MRSKADETLVIVETLICPLQITGPLFLHIVFTWPFLHFLTLPAALADKLLFQFKNDLEFKCVSRLDLHLGRSDFPSQPPTF